MNESEASDGPSRHGPPASAPGGALRAAAAKGARRIAYVFLPDDQILRQRSFQLFLASTFLSDGAREAVRYGALVAVVAAGHSPLHSALLTAISLVPPTLFGILGGEIADALPRRTSLLVTYTLQAASCILIPAFLGIEFWDVALLLFAINLLGQVAGPTEQSLAPLVVSSEQLASANSLLSLSSNVGTLVGTGLLAPVIVATAGARPLFTVAGIMLLLAVNRVFGIRPVEPLTMPEKRPHMTRGSEVLRWLVRQPAVATMVAVAVLTGVANVIFQALGPQYVSDVLGVNPSETVYVFAPAAVGTAIALAVAPGIMKLLGERRTAALGLALVTGMLVLLGLMSPALVDVVDPFNPLRLLSLVKIDLDPQLRTAGFLAAPLGFGLALSTTAVQTYINRRVPLTYQGRAFALQSVLKNGAAIGPLLALGAIASVVGVEPVLVLSPLLLFGVLGALVRLSEHFGAHMPASNLQVLESFWQADEAGQPEAQESGA